MSAKTSVAGLSTGGVHSVCPGVSRPDIVGLPGWYQGESELLEHVLLVPVVSVPVSVLASVVLPS